MAQKNLFDIDTTLIDLSNLKVVEAFNKIEKDVAKLHAAAKFKTKSLVPSKLDGLIPTSLRKKVSKYGAFKQVANISDFGGVDDDGYQEIYGPIFTHMIVEFQDYSFVHVVKTYLSEVLVPAEQAEQLTNEDYPEAINDILALDVNAKNKLEVQSVGWMVKSGEENLTKAKIVALMKNTIKTAGGAKPKSSASSTAPSTASLKPATKIKDVDFESFKTFLGDKFVTAPTDGGVIVYSKVDVKDNGMDPLVNAKIVIYDKKGKINPKIDLVVYASNDVDTEYETVSKRITKVGSIGKYVVALGKYIRRRNAQSKYDNSYGSRGTDGDKSFQKTSKFLTIKESAILTDILESL